MNSDTLVYDLSKEAVVDPVIFVDKKWVSILDMSNGNYSNNQSQLDTSKVSNSAFYANYREGYLVIPMLLTVAATTGGDTTFPGTAANTQTYGMDYVAGLKNWFGQIIHSLTVKYNNSDAVQQGNFLNIWRHFHLMTTLSWEDVKTQGATIGFYPDDPTAWDYSAAATPSGIGLCNNRDAINVPVLPLQSFVGASTLNKGGCNYGYLMRQTYIAYDPRNVGVAGNEGYGSGFISEATAAELWKSHISTRQMGTNGPPVLNGVIQYSINAVVYLKHLHPFFEALPLTKGAFMSMTLNLNNTTVQSGVGTGNYAAPTILTAYGTCPFLLTSRENNNGGATIANAAAAIRANLSVGAICLDANLRAMNGVGQGTIGRQIELHVPLYQFNPPVEISYISDPVKPVRYTDFYQYEVKNIGPNQRINQLLTNGMKDLRSILVIPFISTSEPGLGTDQYKSPFDTAPATTAPLAHLSNFNVQIAGTNLIENSIQYTFQAFNEHLYGANAVNGGLTDGLTSGLIDFKAFENSYCYYYLDLSRMLPTDKDIPHSVTLLGTNKSAKAMDYMVFIEYGCEFKIDVIRGTRFD